MRAELPVARRKFLSLSAGAAAAALLAVRKTVAGEADVIRFGLTPVLLTSDLNLLDLLKSYLEKSTGRPIQLVTRRTYEEISALLISSQLDGAWICSPPFLTYGPQLELLAVPIWNGKPLYRSYLIADAAPRGSVDRRSHGRHSRLLRSRTPTPAMWRRPPNWRRRASSPRPFFRQIFFTYGHENVVRAVASGLAQSGSVDGYVYEVLKEVEPALTGATRVVRPSPWYGFPPIAGPLAAVGTENRDRLRQALLTAHEDETRPAAAQGVAARRLCR